MQICDAVRNVDKPKLQNTGKPKTADFGKQNIPLLKGDLVKDIAYRSNPEKYYFQPCVFATTDTHIDWIKAYCLAENPKAVLGVDMTYKCSLFYVTPVTMKHPRFVKKNDYLSHPGVAVALATSSTKNMNITSFFQRRSANLWLENPQYIGQMRNRPSKRYLKKNFQLKM